MSNILVAKHQDAVKHILNVIVFIKTKKTYKSFAMLNFNYKIC